jgi:hypothetical protein
MKNGGGVLGETESMRPNHANYFNRIDRIFRINRIYQ